MLQIMGQATGDYILVMFEFVLHSYHTDLAQTNLYYIRTPSGNEAHVGKGISTGIDSLFLSNWKLNIKFNCCSPLSGKMLTFSM